MIAGLDMWRYNDAQPFVIKDERLTKRLGVSELRWPPDFREKNADSENCNLKIPAVRFPTWYYCPFCGSMKKTTYYEPQPECDNYPWKDGRVCSANGKFKRKMIPERFVVVCPEGHISDFPIAKWLHSDGQHIYDPNTCKIRRSTGGASANLTGVFYQCTCGAKKSMAGATRKGALKKIGFQCKSSKPWLGIYGGENCNCDPEDVKVVLRGATNVWFADTRSSIHIPTDDEATSRKIIAILDEHFDALNASRVNGQFNKDIVQFLANSKGVDFATLYQPTPDVTEPEPDVVEPEPEKPKTNMMPAVLVMVALIGGGGFFVFKKMQEKKKEKEAAKPDPDADYVDDDEDYGYSEEYEDDDVDFIADDEDNEPV